MKHISALTTLFAVLALGGVSASAQDAASLRERIETHYAAINSGAEDAMILGHHRPDMSIFAAGGSVLMTDKDFLAAAKQSAVPSFPESDVFINDFGAQIYGNVGVATFYLVGSHMRDGQITRGTWRVSAVWVYENGEWKEAHHHESRLTGSF